MNNFKKLLYLLTRQERKSAFWLLVMILINALLDMIGVASILPFITVLTIPDIIQTNSIIKSVYQTSSILGIENEKQFFFALGILTFLILLFTLTFKALTTYVTLRFVELRAYSISKRLVEGYLQQPYSWFLNRNSADLGKTILSEVEGVVGNGIKPMVDIISKSAVSIALIALLVIANPLLALITGLVLGLSYLLIYKFARTSLKKIGKERLSANQLRYTAVSEAFSANKEVKVGGLEKYYIQKFSDPALAYAIARSKAQVITQLPRFVIEVIAFGGIIILILYLMARSDNFIDIIPIIALYALAGYRLMPALQQIYNSSAVLKMISPSLNALYDDLKKLRPNNLTQKKNFLSLTKEITLNKIYYNYPNSERTALKDINLTIPAYSTVGLVGATGSGKTTTVDIILGLLEPQHGTLKLDGRIIDKNNIRDWQCSIGYVPQYIYLSDDTIASNIAFGVPIENINQEAVEHAAKIAKIDEFVLNELPLKYQTTVGERGIRLSGGQRQRIGIARALYHKPKLLILDEATSALDNITEYAVMEAVHSLNKEITIIHIAHRLSTIKNCDIIFLFEKGELKGKGSYNVLSKTNSYFQKMQNKT